MTTELERWRLTEQRLDNLSARIPLQLEGEPLAKFRDAQSRADAALQPFGGFAPSPTQDESVETYQRRLLGRVKEHSPRWRDADISWFKGAALAEVATQVYADAAAEAVNPARVPKGELREVIESDRTGRRISKFIGDPASCWDAFKGPIRHVIGARTR